MLSLRLGKELEKKIENYSQSRGLSKSEFIRSCIQDYLAQETPTSPWELGKDLFGKHKSGQRNLSIQAQDIARRKAKQSRQLTVSVKTQSKKN